MDKAQSRATTLAAELTAKLDELDDRIEAYRSQIAAEYSAFKDELLREQSTEVQAGVCTAIQDRLDHFAKPAPGSLIRANKRRSPLPSQDSSSSSNPNTIAAIQVPMSNLPTIPETGADRVSRSPHEREREFAGIITPSYLPLLDSGSRRHQHSRAISSSDLADLTPIPDGQALAPLSRRVDDVDFPTRHHSMPDESSPSLALPPQMPKRRHSDEMSMKSNYSEGNLGDGSGMRRSALRRRSSGSKSGTMSPRKVRFNFGGGEDYPTTSTPAVESPGLDEVPPEPDPSIGESLFAETTEEQVKYTSAYEILGIDSDSPPPPKRVSSTQRLRELSRLPLDDSTTWKQLKAPPDGSAAVEVTGLTDDEEDESEDEFLVFGSKNTNGKGKGKAFVRSPKDSATKKKVLRSPPPERVRNRDKDAFSAAEDEALSEMVPPTASKAYSTGLASGLISRSANTISSKQAAGLESNAAQLSPTPKGSYVSKSATAKSQALLGTADENNLDIARLDLSKGKKSTSNSDGAEDDDDDEDADDENEPFSFDEAPDKITDKYLKDDDSDSDDDDMPTLRRSNPASNSISLHSTSPAQNISRSGSTPSSSSSKSTTTGNNNNQASRTNRNSNSDLAPTEPANKRYIHPFSNPVVSPSMHDLAASLGTVKTFVGSLNGTTGWDDDEEYSRQIRGNASGAGGGMTAGNFGSVMGSGMDGFAGESFKSGDPESYREHVGSFKERGVQGGSNRGRSLAQRMAAEEMAEREEGERERMDREDRENRW